MAFGHLAVDDRLHPRQAAVTQQLAVDEHGRRPLHPGLLAERLVAHHLVAQILGVAVPVEAGQVQSDLLGQGADLLLAQLAEVGEELSCIGQNFPCSRAARLASAAGRAKLCMRSGNCLKTTRTLSGFFASTSSINGTSREQ